MSSTEPTTTKRLDAEADAAGSTAYKAQLDQAARDANKGSKSPEGKDGGMHPILETVSQYVPAVGKLLANNKGEEKKPEQRAAQEIPEAPVRPIHDVQIEEFVRDQHRSKTEGIMEDKVQ